jgi:hypothetical protein
MSCISLKFARNKPRTNKLTQRACGITHPSQRATDNLHHIQPCSNTDALSVQGLLVSAN